MNSEELKGQPHAGEAQSGEVLHEGVRKGGDGEEEEPLGGGVEGVQQEAVAAEGPEEPRHRVQVEVVVEDAYGEDPSKSDKQQTSTSTNLQSTRMVAVKAPTSKQVAMVIQ